MIYTFTMIINKEGKWYVAQALELGVVTQGKTIEQAEKNLKEAVELYLEDERAPKKLLQQQQHPFVSVVKVEYA
ncbi:MAG: type II toxin-antitoxin system HicB family antitoxin [Candidatus Kerfeldbacteria bacterium]|nr:type II toxin-antitoxin system HicB family antitoxin [Candidatus Kerfeldbacteria bacterium]